MLKILYIISTLEKTGPVNVLFDIIQNIDRNKFEPVILTLSKEKKNSIKSKFENLNVEIHSMNLQGVNGYLNSFKIKSVVQKIKPNIIHTHCFRSTLFTAIYLRKMNTITTIHCDYDSDYRMTYGNTIGCIMSKLMDFSLKNIKKRIACSEYLSQIINSKKKFNVEFVNNGIDTEIYHPIEDKHIIRKKLNLPVDKKIFIWVGCLTERKNPLFLAKMIKEISFKNCFFIFCGDGPLKQELENTISNFNNVLLTGNIDNIQEYLQASDYYISTSLSEGLPLSVLEGMACGLPVLLSNIEQHIIWFKNNIDIGSHYILDDNFSFILEFDKLINKNYSQIKKNTRLLVQNSFNTTDMSNNYEQVYKEF